LDKLTIGLLADILYTKEIICFEELQGLMDIKHPTDVDAFVERMMRGEFNVYKRGEHYSQENKPNK
jgi:hypothetical protein